ncbi:fibronectin domain protein [Fulvivirga imtechensis AK7]|uniref:Fibronectin domain protein n=2 Tax=Fulvivirga TaxID=396811 RepID=L8K193_9BACT|nr:fibronectin domain protein [Fulvivirga imtechensis AK7]
MKSVGIIFFLLFFTIQTWAQDILFLGEGRKDEVRLFWIPKKQWDEGLKGFYIKRQSDGSWEKLNNTLIVPGTFEGKPLDNLGLSRGEVNRLEDKRSRLISSGSLNSISTDQLITVMTDEHAVKGISVMLNLDFDVALIAGFGYVDTDIPQAREYTYGLFPVYNTGESNDPVSTFSWVYNTSPEINVPLQGTSKVNQRRKTVELTWELDVEAYKSYKILNGFNIYRKEEGAQGFTKLNDSPIWVPLNDKKSTLFYKDEDIDTEKSYTYAAAPATIFNTRGNMAELEVTAATHAAEVQPPVLKDPQKDHSLNFEWKFDGASELSIAGFYVQLKQKDGLQFDNISDLLPPSTRAFSYNNLPTADNSYYHFRVIAVKTDGLELWSNRKIFFNRANTRPSQPLDLQGEVSFSGEEVVVNLTWTKPAQNADHVREYLIYTSSPNQDRVVKEGSIEPVTTESYTYSVYRDRAANYSFAVSAVNEQNEESPLSGKVTITVPSKSLPFINIWPIAKDGNVITLNWKYDDDITDLAGFRLYQNGELIADEGALNASARQWISPQLDAGNYTYEIVAVSTSDVQSERSDPRKFEIR